MSMNGKRLKFELKNTKRHHLKLGRLNHRISFILYFAAVLASVFASILIADDFGLEHKTTLIVITATPSWVLLLNNVLKFKEKASWYYKYYHLLSALERQLLDQGKPIKVVSQDLTNMRDKMHKIYPQFDSSGFEQN